MTHTHTKCEAISEGVTCVIGISDRKTRGEEIFEVVMTGNFQTQNCRPRKLGEHRAAGDTSTWDSCKGS